MAVTAKIYSQIFGIVFNKEVDLLTDAIKVVLMTSTYALDQDAHDYYNDITNELATAGGYTAGGATLANDTFGYTSGSNLWTYDADDVSWAASTLTAAEAAVYDDTAGAATTDPLIVHQDFGGDFTTAGGTFTIQWNASGIFTITVA